MKKLPSIISLSLTAIMLIVVIVLFRLITFNKTDQLSLPKDSGVNQSKNKIANTLYPANPESSGRDIYYSLYEFRKNFYPGVGVYYYGSNNTNYIVGSFVRWENVSGSRDKYLVLEDKLRVNIKKGAVDYPRIRVGFSTKEDVYQEKFTTALAVENLDSVLSEKVDLNGSSIYKMSLIGTFSDTDLNTLIQPGDAILVLLKREQKGFNDLQGSDKTKVAEWIIIRRYDPKITLQAELGKSFPLGADKNK